MATNALADAVQGAKRPSQIITWTDKNGTALDLTGATITAKIKNLSSGSTVASDGVFTITDAAAGKFRWAYSTTDVADAGDYSVQFEAAYGSAPTPARTFIASWKVQPALTVSS